MASIAAVPAITKAVRSHLLMPLAQGRLQPMFMDAHHRDLNSAVTAARSVARNAFAGFQLGHAALLRMSQPVSYASAGLAWMCE